MSIASEITRLQGAKADIKSAIEAKGVTVPSNAKLDDYDTYIDEIETGGGTAETLADVNKVLDGFYDYLNDLPSSYETITSDNVVLYTPSQDFTTYYITKNNNIYRIAWTKQGVGIAKASSGTSAGKFEVAIDRTTGELYYAPYMIEYYRDDTFTGYYSLEEAINALKNSSTAYRYYSNSYISLSEGDYIVTNGFAVNTTTDEPRLCKKISSNETIQTIS